MGSSSSMVVEEFNSIDLLIFGYIHVIEHILSIHHGVKLVIPTDITRLCLLYYKATPFELFMLTNVIDKDCKKTKNSNGIKCIDFNGRKIIRFSVFDINNKKKLTTTHEIWECMKGGLCVGRNINLPSFINTKYKKILTSTFTKNTLKKSTINIFFKIGGIFPNRMYEEYTNICYGIIFDSLQIDWIRIPMNGFSNIDTLQLTLPPLPHKSTATSIYSYKYNKVISIIDNYEPNIYELSFNNHECHDIKDWKWNIITKMEQENYSFNQPSMCFVNKSEDEEQLLICGGIEDNYKLLHLYNLETKKWIKLKDITYIRCGCGIYYDDKFTKNVYVGGGLFSNDNGTKIVEQYDFNKNYWQCLPETLFEHNYYPPIWIDENIGKHIIFIAGFRPNDIGIIEFYDLRTGNKKWNQANKYIQHNITNAIPKNAVIERLFI